eukprot:10871776-Alexandrium_andersonii.AAC.1
MADPAPADGGADLPAAASGVPGRDGAGPVPGGLGRDAGRSRGHQVPVVAALPPADPFDVSIPRRLRRGGGN